MCNQMRRSEHKIRCNSLHLPSVHTIAVQHPDEPPYQADDVQRPHRGPYEFDLEEFVQTRRKHLRRLTKMATPLSNLMRWTSMMTFRPH